MGSIRSLKLGRIHRLLQLITLMESGTPLSAIDLATRLGVSRRTLFRDLKTLLDAGIPYHHDPERGYRIDPGFFLPPVNLKVNEALGLLLLGKVAASQRMQPFYRPAAEAIGKLAATLPGPYKDVTTQMLRYITVQPGQPPNVTQKTDYFVTLQLAIEEQRICRLRYDSRFGGEGRIETDLHPYHLHFGHRAWYVVGHSRRHGETRMFKLARIADLELTPHRFQLDEPFSIGDHLGKAWAFIPEGRVYRVELEFTAMVGANVAEVLWHPTQQHELLADGRCVVRFEVDGLGEITWWLLGYGDQVDVRRPKALRDRLRKVHEAAAAKLKCEGD